MATNYYLMTLEEYLTPKFDKYQRWRQIARSLGLSKDAKQRLGWIIYYKTTSQENASLVCRRFGISRKTFYKWFNQFDDCNLRSLEDKSRAPQKRRKREYTGNQYVRVVQLRRQYIRYGKNKLLILYRQRYSDDAEMSAWKIQCIIQRSGLYFNQVKQTKINKKRANAVKKKRIVELKKIKRKGFLICLDTIVVYFNGSKRYIITAIDYWTKVAFARMYKTHGSNNSKDFLERLVYLLDGKIENIQTDNGSEFEKYFDVACKKIGLERYYSRVRTPKDNPVCERFNRTLEEEFIDLGNLTSDTEIFNRKLTEWLVHYNFGRPHQSLDYMPPMNFTFKYHKVLPMYPSSTLS